MDNIMQDFSAWFRLVLAILAVWRITHLLAQEDGPGNLIFKLRKVLGTSFLGKLMDCFLCLSIWIALPASLYVTRSRSDLILVWLAISGGASLLFKLQERVTLDDININVSSNGNYKESGCNHMGCCGDNRRSLNVNVKMEKDNALDSKNKGNSQYHMIRLEYLEKSTLTIIGKGTGMRYIFSSSNNIQHVDHRDIDSLLRSGMFRRVA